MREITACEIGKLLDCVKGLSEYHNEVSVNFKGAYPSRPYEKTLALFREAVTERGSRIAVEEQDGEIVGFCKADLDGENGKLDYLFVKEAFRGQGYGGALMDWVMAVFAEAGVHHIEVKVVDGNPTIHLYEKYGFRMNAHILVNNT